MGNNPGLLPPISGPLGTVYTETPTSLSRELVFTSLTESDGGNYSCVAGPLMFNHTVTVHGPDMIHIEQPQSPVYNIGTNVSFNCEIAANSLYRNPVWSNPRGDAVQPLDQGGNAHLHTVQSSESSSTLNLVGVSPLDAGTYKCVVGAFQLTVNVIVNVDECEPPCLNGGECIDQECVCQYPFVGPMCGQLASIKRCLRPCLNGAECVNGVCNCLYGFTGPQCNMTDEAIVRVRIPDQDNPILGADVSYICEVPQDNPYGSPIWINPEGQQIQPMGLGGNSHMKTEQVSPYATRLFIMDIQLEDEGQYICAVGPLRRLFNIMVDEVACIPQCLNGGTCVMGSCYCPDGFTGPACLQRIIICDPPCLNGGLCLSGACSCPEGYGGEACEMPGVDLRIDGPESVILMAGDDLRLICQVNDDTYGSPMWLDAQGDKVSEGTLDEAIGTYHHTHLMTELIMYNAQAFDSGEYTCTVGPFQETTMVLVAGEEPDCLPVCRNGGDCVNGVCQCTTDWLGTECKVPANGYISITPDPEQQLTPGSEVRYMCQVQEGDHFVQRPQWFRNGQLIPAQFGDVSNVFVNVLTNMSSELVIRNLDETDLGVYYCTGGPDVKYINVNYAEIECNPPCENGGTCNDGECQCPEGFNGPTCSRQAEDFIVISEPQGQRSEVGGNATFLCEVPESSSYDPPQWLNSTGQPVLPFGQGSNSRVYTKEISSYATQLHFEFAESDDSGQYSCSVGPFTYGHNITFEDPDCNPECLQGECIDGRCVCPVGLIGMQCNIPDNTFILVSEPTGQVPVVGQNQSYLCEVSRENPYGKPVWRNREGVTINSTEEGGTDHMFIENLSPFATRLFINDLRLNDAGMYVCNVGPVDKRFTVLVNPLSCENPCLYGGRCVEGVCECLPGFLGDQCETPNFVVSIDQTRPALPQTGDSVSFVCEVDHTAPYQNPVWYDPQGNIIDPSGDSHYTILALDRKATRLVINELLPTDSGPYVCNVGPVTTEFSVQVQPAHCSQPCINGGTCVRGMCECSEEFQGSFCQIGVKRPFSIEIQGPPREKPEIGDDLTLICRVSQEEQGIPTWLGPDNQPIAGIQTGQRIFADVQSNTETALTIVAAESGDAGRYSCVVGMNRADYLLSVSGPECIIPCSNGGTCVEGRCQCGEGFDGGFCQNVVTSDYELRIRVQRNPQFLVGINTKVLCEIRGNTNEVNPQWYGPDSEVIRPAARGGNKHINTRNTRKSNRLSINELMVEDAGEYTCRVGPIESSFVLFPRSGECEDICTNGGTCDNGACLCPIGFAGRSCEIPVGPEGIRVNITITSSLDRDPNLDEEIIFLCQVSPNPLYTNPKWHGPNGEVFPVVNTLDPLRPPIHAVQLTPLMTQLTISSVSEEMSGMYACTAGPLTSLYPLNIPPSTCEQPCENGGNCVRSQCVCKQGFEGEFCEIEVEVFYNITITPDQELTPSVGDSVSFLCESEGPDAPLPIWYDQNGNRISPSRADNEFANSFSSSEEALAETVSSSDVDLAGQLVQVISPTQSRLVLNDISEADSGIYTCAAEPKRDTIVVNIYIPRCLPECLNGGSCEEGICRCTDSFTGSRCQYSYERDFSVEFDPNLDEPPTAGQSYSVACEINGPVEAGRPMWIGPLGQEIAPAGHGGSDHVHVEFQGMNVTTLHLDSITSAQAGLYICTSGPVAGVFNLSLALHCSPPCMNGGVCQGGRCECPESHTGETCSQPVPGCHSMQACYNGGTCLENRCFCKPDFTGELCQFTVSIDANLRIELDPDNDYTEGGNVSFLCITNGNDAPLNPRWRKGDYQYIQSPVFGEGNHIFTSRKSGFITQLRIMNVSVQDSGTYTCNAGPLQQSISLTIYNNTYPCIPRCVNGGRCIEGICICLEGYTGEACDQLVPECQPLCENGGECLAGECNCPRGFNGSYCQYQIVEPISIAIHPEEGQVFYTGENIAFLCLTQGTFAPEDPQWREPSGRVVGIRQTSVDRIFTFAVNSTATRLYIRPLAEGDAGYFTCATGPLNSTVFISIEERPCPLNCANGGTCMDGICSCPEGYQGSFCQIGIGFQSSIVIIPSIEKSPMVGEDIEFLCRTSGANAPRYPFWRNPNGKVISSNPSIRDHRVYTQRLSDYETKLIIHNFTNNDMGIYRCNGGPLTTTFTIVLAERSCDPPCINGGTCNNGVCDCADGFIGGHCELRGCFPLCINGGICRDGSCRCPAGYVGDHCQVLLPVSINIVPSQDSDPRLGGTISYLCSVNDTNLVEPPVWRGLEGLDISYDFGRIRVESPSLGETRLVINNLQETDTGTYTCAAGPIEGSVYVAVQPLSECLPECINGGQCAGGVCICQQGYEGAFCEIEDTCEPGCLNGGTCDRGLCICPAGIGGVFCQLRLERQCRVPCQNNARCMNGICLCQPGFEGLACQFRKRDCPEYCQHGGTCINGTCFCLSGYLGEFCEIRPVECIPSCINGGFCNSGVCICPDGYTGPSCEVSVGSQPQIVVSPFQAQVLALGEDTTIFCKVKSRDVDESPQWYSSNGTLINTIGNGGTTHKHVSEIDSQTIELVINDFQVQDVGNYSCTAGPLSTNIALFILPISCTHPCLNGGHCQNGVCVCAEDFYGEFCELSNFTDSYVPCEPECENGATCVQGLCLCPLGYRGETCAEEMSCDPVCENNAVCVLGYCRCPVGFTGKACNEDIDECEINPTICKHECFNTIGSFYCSCAPGYQLGPDRRCVDIDECEGEHDCEQRCLNTIGSYLCACFEGFILEADGNTCVGPSGCVYENHLYPSGTTWTVDGCTECSCDLGVTTCTDCPTPKFQQCTYQGIEYDHATNWTSPFDPCDHCNCTDGQVKCMREICDIQCDYPAPHQTECCHECTDCLYEGNVIRNHLYFSPLEPQCTTCICQDGNVRCSNVSCPEIDCSRPIQGECCLTCEDNCEFQGAEYQDGETFTAESLDCSVCTCKKGVVECRPFDCPPLNCSRNERVQLPGDCCPKCISAVPGCVDKYGLLHQYETTWNDPRDNCLTCTCLNTGEVQCAREQCEFNCNNPVHVRGQCCPDCNGCYYNGIGFSYGATFTSAFDKCDSCICLGGDVICEPTSCNVQCSAPYHPPGECCPLCEDCYFLGQIIPDGEYFNPALDSCKTCHCDKGSVQCTEREQCPMLNCPVTTTVAGECCPSCADAFCRSDDGSEHRSGDSWISSSDPCQECTCLDTIINCMPLPCLEASNCTHGVQIEGVCCPDCTVCEFEGNLYRNGSSFSPNENNCRRCECLNGNVVCDEETCPPIYCSQTVQAFGQCCPHCAVCTARDGTIYSHGQTWQDGEDPCTTCRCIDTEIECNTPICPVGDCIDPQFDIGECCASCQGCTYDNTNYTNGQTFSPTTHDCMECVCQDDRLNCQPITCPIPDCPSESVVFRDGACCPDCVDHEVSRMTCQIGDVILQSGSSHQPDECSTCLCMAGELLCEAQECLDTGCPQIRQVRPPGSCCPVCKLDACVFDGRLVPDNEVFKPMGDVCTNCTCTDGSVACHSISCPEPDCPAEEQIQGDGDCCRHCAGTLQLRDLPCTFQGETIPSGGSFMIGCQECICEGGNPRCARRQCPVLNCLGGEEIQMAADGCCEECVPKIGSCIVFGDPHYRTFDKKFHDFQGTCTYTLAKDCSTNQFEIIVQNNGKETYAVSWTELVSFKVHNVTIDLLPNFAVRLNKEEITLPYLNEPEFSIQKLGLMVVVHTNIGISLSWDGAHFAEVEADGIWEGLLCGLCGDYNGNPDDDFRASNGTLCGTASEFGNTFLVGDYAECSCQESVEQTPCIRNDNADMEFMAREKCSILKGEPFAAAHALVPPMPFFEACMYDLCACPAQERCLCDVLTAYSHEARKKGIMIDWQRDNYCAISCPEGAVYNECTPSCVQTCATVNTIEDPLECNQLENCIPGCKCPAGMVLHDFRCIMPEDCPL